MNDGDFGFGSAVAPHAHTLGARRARALSRARAVLAPRLFVLALTFASGWFGPHVWAQDVQLSEPAIVRVWNRDVVTLRAAIDGLEPHARAEAARRRIEGLPIEALSGSVHTTASRFGELEGLFVMVGPLPIVALLREDLDLESGQTLDQLGVQTTERLHELLAARLTQRSLPHLMRSVALSLGASVLLALALVVIVRARRIVLAREAPWIGLSRYQVLGVEVGPFFLGFKRILIATLSIATGLLATYLWLSFLFIQFPYTAPWGTELGHYLRRALAELGSGAVASVPGLFAVAVIFIVTRVVARAFDGFFQSVEARKINVDWLDPETARATRRLAVTLLWLFALTVAYPYIPGSSSDAFRGVSVLAGLMLTLGSAGLVNQVMSGLVVVYSRACKNGDYVRVGETEGLVSNVGMLSTKVVTKRREEITIPNAVMASTTVINYSRVAGPDGAIATTSVTIGYDVPWRQVHALLELAAARATGVASTTPPRVLQRALLDFYVEYELQVPLEHVEDRVVVLSQLHAQIQDAFNEFGVQIMSPHFESQPDGKVGVDRSRWHEAPAGSKDGRAAH